MSADVVELSPAMIAFNQGRIAFRRGAPRPRTPRDRKPWVTRKNMFWLGYMFERGKGMMAAMRNGEIPKDAS